MLGNNTINPCKNVPDVSTTPEKYNPLAPCPTVNFTASHELSMVTPWGYHDCVFSCTVKSRPDSNAAIAQAACTEGVVPCYWDHVSKDSVCGESQDSDIYWPLWVCHYG